MYVILTAKPDTWFKEGTEVFHYDKPIRFTVEEYREYRECGGILCRGTTSRDSAMDGEYCMIEEFDVAFSSETPILKSYASE